MREHSRCVHRMFVQMFAEHHLVCFYTLINDCRMFTQTFVESQNIRKKYVL